MNHRRIATNSLSQIAFAIVIWLGLGFSLGWYYTFTYYGKTGLPMPMVEPCLALILYYFSVLNIDTEGQAIHWMIVFPIAGLLWVVALRTLAQRMGATPPPPAACAAAVAVASVPLVLPGPWMALIAAQVPDGLSWDTMLRVALRRANITPWPWLSPMYTSLGLVGLGLQIAVYRRLFPFRGTRAFLHAGMSAVIAVLLAVIIAAVSALPLRALLE